MIDAVYVYEAIIFILSQSPNSAKKYSPGGIDLHSALIHTFWVFFFLIIANFSPENNTVFYFIIFPKWLLIESPHFFAANPYFSHTRGNFRTVKFGFNNLFFATRSIIRQYSG